MEEERPKFLYLTNNYEDAQLLNKTIKEMKCEPIETTTLSGAKGKLGEEGLYAIIMSGTVREEHDEIPKGNIGWDFLLELINQETDLKLAYLSCTELGPPYEKIDQNCTRISIGDKSITRDGIRELLKNVRRV